jgi:multidrug transporter EmrE-like cation transporter
MFFALNLIFNGIMWGLFTTALARGSSTTRVSIVNTSANFMLTAIMGWIIFRESLPPLWWVGAAMLVAGNVVIGRREEEKGGGVRLDGDAAHEEGAIGVRGAEEEVLLGEVADGLEEGERRHRESLDEPDLGPLK